MIEEIRNIKRTKKDLRKFGLVVGLFFIIIAAVLFWKGNQSFTYFFIIGLTLIIGGAAIPVILTPLYLVWMTFAVIMGWIMTRVILSILFYLIIMPIGLIPRMFGKQFLELKWDRTQDTYWNYRSMEQLKKDQYEKQF